MDNLVQIFIVHSGKDEWLINPIASNLRLIDVEPYIAKLEDPTPYPLPQKLDIAIQSSAAMFVFLTHNIVSVKDTRDIVNWEISSAYAKKKPIYVFTEKGVDIPLLLNHISVYATFDLLNQESLNKMVKKVQQIAKAFKKNADKAKTALTIVLLILGLGLFFGALSGD